MPSFPPHNAVLPWSVAACPNLQRVLTIRSMYCLLARGRVHEYAAVAPRTYKYLVKLIVMSKISSVLRGRATSSWRLAHCLVSRYSFPPGPLVPLLVSKGRTREEIIFYLSIPYLPLSTTAPKFPLLHKWIPKFHIILDSQLHDRNSSMNPSTHAHVTC